MKKLLTFMIALLLLVSLTMALLFGLLNTSYATPVIQWLNRLVGDPRLSFAKAEYDYPLHIRLTEPTVTLSNTSMTFKHMDIWFNHALYDNHQWQIDSILFDGASIHNMIPRFVQPTTFKIHQLAVHNLELHHDDISATHVNVQVKEPHWYGSNQWLPYGDMQIAAREVQWQGEHIHDLLIDMNHQWTDSTINGFSFDWRGGLVSGQAEHYPSGWSLVNVTMNHLNLTDNMLAQLDYKWRALPPRLITHINSLDILNSQLELGAVTLNNVDLSIEDWTINPFWQTQGALSLHADNAKWKGITLVEPDLTLKVSPGKVTITDFIADVWQGRLQLAGTMTPHRLHLSQFNMNGIRWYGEQAHDFPSLSLEDIPWSTIDVDQLAFNNAQLIQLTHKPFWQLSGFSIQGQDLSVRRNMQFGLWQGDLSLSAHSASIGELRTSQAIIEMNNHHQTWSVTRAFLPLKHGYVKAQGTWPMSDEAKPWAFNMQAAGLPLEPLTQRLSLPLTFSGFADMDMTISGMTGNATLIKHTLSGKAQATIYHGVMTTQHNNTTVIQPFGIDNLHVTADRGRVSIPETTIQGTTLDAALSAQFDLAKQPSGHFTISENTQGQTTTYELLHASEQQPARQSKPAAQ